MNSEKRASFLYMEVYERLRHRIDNGELQPGARIPTEEELAASFHVSRITIKKALQMMQNDGLIERVQGRGTFVCTVSPVPDHPMPLTRRTDLVGIVLEHVSSPFGLGILYQIDQLLRDAGFTLLIRFSYGNVERESHEIESLLSLGIRALIIMPCHNSYYNTEILRLVLDKFPVVLIDKRMHGLPIASVCTDGAGATFSLVKHLAERGCKEAALITIDPSSTTSLSDRVSGFYSGLKACGLRSAGECLLPRRIADMPSSAQDSTYVQTMTGFLASCKKLPQAFVLTEYALAKYLVPAAKHCGLVIGQDFKACCIDEDYEAAQGYFFTHMHQDESGIASQVVRLLLEMMSGREVNLDTIKINAIFHQGETT